MRTRTWLLALALSLSFPTRALAQPEDATAQADERFRKGREAQDHGDYKLALELFRESQDLKPGRGKLLNIAICEEKLGLLATAMRDFQDLLPKLADDPERTNIVKEHIASLDPRLPHIKITLDAGAPPGTTVTYDGAPLAPAALGTEMAADPGNHRVTVNATGRSVRGYDVLAEEAKRAELTVQPGAASPLPDKPPPVTEREPVRAEPPQGKRVAGFVIGGLGAVGLGAFGVTGIMAIVDHQSVEGACPTHKGCTQDVLDQASRGKALSIASTIAFATGAAFAGIGVALVLSSKPSAPAVGLTLLPDGGRVGFVGAF